MSQSYLLNARDWSATLQRALNGTPAFGEWLEQAAQEPVCPERIAQWFEDLSGQVPSEACLDLPTCRKVLRILRKRVFYVAMTRDLAGVAPLQEVVGAMSELADIAVEQAYRSVMADLVEVHGIPRNSAGLPQEMIVIGMGKLGGRELNVSSDIDLVMLYDEEGETDGRRPISNHEFYGKLTQRMMPILSEQDGDGQVFRTDLRLRPDGDAGPLAWSLEAFEKYLYTQGREWERYAWLKGRVMPTKAFADSHSMDTIRHIESMRLPFVYRKYFDFDALDALRVLRERIRQDWQRKVLARRGQESQNNIKLGEGGIREIEFVVQLSQLIRGGRMPALQQRGLLEALAAQQRAGIIEPETAEKLANAYCFLRQTEHALQYYDDAQTHMLPSEPGRRQALARALRRSPASFEQTLLAHRTFVAETFRNAFRMAGLQDDTAPESTQHNGGDTDHALIDPLTELEKTIALFGRDATELTRRTESFLESHRIRSLSTVSRNRVDAVLPNALLAAQNTPVPMTAAIKMLDLIETIAQRSAYLALLAEYPETLARIARMLAASPTAAQYLIQHPVVLDSLIAWRTLMEPVEFERLAQSLRADLNECLLADGTPDVEQQMNLMRDLQRQISFQLLAQDIEGRLTVEALADQLSALADMLLNETIYRVWPLVAKTEGPLPLKAPRFAVIAYGRLGGKELGYASDLDVIFLYDDPSEDAAELYGKLGRRMTSWLSTMTSSGRLYEVDLRLRPDGDAGLLAVSVQAFETYQMQHAWPWEHQALTRARFAAGDPTVGALFEAVRRKVLTMPRDAALFRDEVRKMRDKMTAGHPNKTDLFDIKHDKGGMVDLEFVTQYLVLTQADKHPDLIGNLGNIALLRIAAEVGLLTPDLAKRVGNAYRNLRRRQHAVRLQGAEHARVGQDELQEAREAVKTLWRQIIG